VTERHARCRGPSRYLDEPTNHLDAESVAWLQHHLEAFPGCVILVTHDRYFLDQVTKWTLELDRGRGHPHEGNYSAWLEIKAKRSEQESTESEGRKKALSRELEWVRQSPKARQAKSKARLTRYEEMAAEAEREKQTFAQIQIPPGPRLGQNVIEFENLKKGFGDKLLIDGLSFKLPPGGIVGIIGPNGAGKSTLFKMITGAEKPDDGKIEIGESVKLGFVDQSRDALDDAKTIWEEISGGLDVVVVGNREIPSRAYVSSFNFKGSDQQKKVGQLSGGERNRVHLAKTLLTGANVLLLDEPTNDLEVETLQSLEAALEDFAGCAVGMRRTVRTLRSQSRTGMRRNKRCARTGRRGNRELGRVWQDQGRPRVFWGIGALNARAAEMLQKEIDALDRADA
jgi:ATPase subunit of ABC transporter with duplicated ATPase domains